MALILLRGELLACDIKSPKSGRLLESHPETIF